MSLLSEISTRIPTNCYWAIAGLHPRVLGEVKDIPPETWVFTPTDRTLSGEWGKDLGLEYINSIDDAQVWFLTWIPVELPFSVSDAKQEVRQRFFRLQISLRMLGVDSRAKDILVTGQQVHGDASIKTVEYLHLFYPSQKRISRPLNEKSISEAQNLTRGISILESSSGHERLRRTWGLYNEH